MSGRLREHGRLTIDLSLRRSGDIQGKIALHGAILRVVRVRRSTYVYVSRSYYRYLRSARQVPASLCALVCGKYIKAPGGQLAKINLARLARLVTRHLHAPKGRVQVSVTTFAGQPAYEVTQSGNAAFFAMNGHHYLIGYRSRKQHMAITFSEWNSVRRIRLPPASKIAHLG